MASGALSVPQGVGSALATQSMAPPPPRAPKRKEVQVLDEDEWSSRIEAIIERDFFPELAKLQSKVEWLQAIRSGDPQQIRQAQLNIAQRRARSHTPGMPLFTPGGTAARLVPGTTPYFPDATPAAAPRREGTGGPAPTPSAPAAGPSDAPPPDASLDAFMAAHTSEDNASFEEILEDVNKRRRLRQAARSVHQNPQLLLADGRSARQNPQLLLTDGRERIDGFGTGGQQPDTLVTWQYRPLNALYYDSSTRDVVPYTERELSDMVQGPPKQILHRNTRFPKPDIPASAASSAAATPDIHGGTAGQQGAAAAAGGGAAVRAAGVRGTAGYDIMATPSFDPGVDGTPFMTWGDIEATPLRIEAEDLPPGPLTEGGGKFRVADMPAKEQRAHALASKAATSLRRRGKGSATPLAAAAAAAVARREGTPGLGGGAAQRPPSGARPPTMSDAARRLASSLQGKRASADSQLRKSYAQTLGDRRGGVAAGRPGSRPPTGAGGGSTWTSAAPTPSRAWTPAGTPSVHATLEEEQLRVQALLKLKEEETKERAELAAARAAALSSFQKPDSTAGGGTGTGSVTDGLLKI